jgi:type II secretory pathway pseudopilin PulG
MNTSKLSQCPASARSEFGFSLIEVVLAIGIFLVTVLALVGLLGPTLQSVDEVEKTDEIASVVNTVNAFLQSSPDIAVGSQSKFETIYEAISNNSNSEATIFVYRYYDNKTDPDNETIALEVGFATGEPVDVRAKVNQPATNPANFADAAGPIYRVVLTASSVTPAVLRSPNRNADGIYTLSAGVANYPEGYLAMEVRIYPENPPGPSGNFNSATNLTALRDIEPLFTYNTAVVR